MLHLENEIMVTANTLLPWDVYDRYHYENPHFSKANIKTNEMSLNVRNQTLCLLEYH